MGSNQSSGNPPSLGDVVGSLGGPSTEDWNSLFKDISQVRFFRNVSTTIFSKRVGLSLFQNSPFYVLFSLTHEHLNTHEHS